MDTWGFSVDIMYVEELGGLIGDGSVWLREKAVHVCGILTCVFDNSILVPVI